MGSLIKIYLPIFFLVFIVLVFVVPSVRVFRQTGINPFRFVSDSDSVHDFAGRSMKVFVILILLTLAVHSIFPYYYQFLGPLHFLESDKLKLLGIILVHTSLAGVIIAQNNMKQSWRIGIDFENKTPLVTKGLFRISRNPVFLFLLIELTGIFLILPNAITFAVLFAAFLTLQVTMRLEEEFLYKQHGEEYLMYKKRVRRLI